MTVPAPGLGPLPAAARAAVSEPRPTARATTFAERLASRTPVARGSTPTSFPVPDRAESPWLVDAQRFIAAVSRDQTAIERAVTQAASGHTLTAGELLALQTRVYRFGRQVDLAAKVVEKSVGTVRRVIDLQV